MNLGLLNALQSKSEKNLKINDRMYKNSSQRFKRSYAKCRSKK